MFILITFGLYVQSRFASGIGSVSYHNDLLPIVYHGKHTIVIDQGIMGKRASAVSWVNYTLIPELIKQTGRFSIDHMIVLQPSIRTFEALVALSAKVHINAMYIPIWTGSIPRGMWRHFFILTERIKQQGGKVIRIGKYASTITLSSDFVVSIKPLGAQLKYGEAIFPALSVQGQIDEQSFAFCPAKYRNKRVTFSEHKGVSDGKESVISSSTRGLSSS
jgi:hypothetical protein